MKDLAVTLLILIAGFINFVPVVGVVSRHKLEKLYGTGISDPNLEIFMRHRAVMFGMLGAFMIYAALSGGHRLWAIGAGLVSMTAFIALAFSVGGFNASISKINRADYFAIACLLIALGLLFGK